MRRALIALLGFTVGGPAWADALRCGQSIVTEGLRDFEVIERCGEPLTQRSWTEVRGYDVGPVDLYYVVIEEWVYDTGSRKLRRLLRFENGELVAVETLRRAP
jgi:hypothetical protein